MSEKTDREKILQDEVEQLKAELEKLRGELGKSRARREEVGDTVNRAVDRGGDEISKLVRGVTLAYLEEIKLVADVVGSFADEVTNRNRPKDENVSARDLAGDLADDVYRSAIKAADRLAEIPEKVVDKFYKGYKEGRYTKSDKA